MTNHGQKEGAFHGHPLRRPTAAVAAVTEFCPMGNPLSCPAPLSKRADAAQVSPLSPSRSDAENLQDQPWDAAFPSRFSELKGRFEGKPLGHDGASHFPLSASPVMAANLCPRRNQLPKARHDAPSPSPFSPSHPQDRLDVSVPEDPPDLLLPLHVEYLKRWHDAKEDYECVGSASRTDRPAIACSRAR